jgi:hypothetical protein
MKPRRSARHADLDVGQAGIKRAGREAAQAEYTRRGPVSARAPN